MIFQLNGTWELFPVSPDEPEVSLPEDLDGLKPISGQVPGNIELDLAAAQWIDEPFVGKNAKALRPFEFYDFWYRKFFRTPEFFAGPVKLCLQGVDCFAEIFLNRKKIGECRNAFMEHGFPVTLAADEENELAVRIIPAEIAARSFPDEPGAEPHMKEEYSSQWVRKPAHAYGWDIAPRMLLGGLWKDVFLFKEDCRFRFSEVWVQTFRLDRDGTAGLQIYYRFEAGRNSLDGFTLRFTGVCGDSRFEIETPAFFTSGTVKIDVPNPKLWFPKGYGQANLYQIHTALYDPKKNCKAEFDTQFGIRTVELERTELNLGGQGKFCIKINGIPIRVKGSNHVPFDALHSRDKDRIDQVLKLFDELQCNMIRCWGGGVYESDEFFDFCDRHGIMVWQDFMMACAIYPKHPDFLAEIREEAEWAVRKLRSKTSLVLWCGDNECDQYAAVVCNVPVDRNPITRKLLPEILERLDPTRPYHPCSPYISEAAQKYGENVFSVIPECHLWGAREHFKLPFYSKSGAKFISETGWYGCPNRSTLERFLSPGHCKLDDRDPEWDYHSSNPFGKNSYMAERSQLIGRQLQEYFNLKPSLLEQYIKASQIFQAEALKFMIETARLDPGCSGILWWNVIDCWPQFSDSAVDYYFGKKLAFHYIKRVQSPFCIMCSEPDPWESRIMAVNDSSESAAGQFSLESEGNILLQGDFELPPYGRQELGRLRSPRSSNELWLLHWNNKGENGVNHYVSGGLTVDYDWYCSRLPAIAALDGSFEADKVGL